MEIGALVTRSVLTIKESDCLRDAATWMMERGVGSAVVVTDGKPTGIVTDRDTLKAIAQGADGNFVKVRDCLTRRVTTATESLELLDAAQIMRDKGFRHLIIVDDEGGLVGVFPCATWSSDFSRRSAHRPKLSRRAFGRTTPLLLSAEVVPGRDPEQLGPVRTHVQFLGRDACHDDRVPVGATRPLGE